MTLKDLTDDPGDANQLLWLGLDALTVLVHTICIWALALPLMLACIGFQVRLERRGARPRRRSLIVLVHTFCREGQGDAMRGD